MRVKGGKGEGIKKEGKEGLCTIYSIRWWGMMIYMWCVDEARCPRYQAFKPVLRSNSPPQKPYKYMFILPLFGGGKWYNWPCKQKTDLTPHVRGGKKFPIYGNSITINALYVRMGSPHTRTGGIWVRNNHIDQSQLRAAGSRGRARKKRWLKQS